MLRVLKANETVLKKSAINFPYSFVAKSVAILQKSFIFLDTRVQTRQGIHGKLMHTSLFWASGVVKQIQPWLPLLLTAVAGT